MKKLLIGFLLGVLASGTIVYAANYLYKADEVSYDPKDTNWNVDNVDSAIKELYNKINDANSALLSLKNTAIAKAVGANGDTFSSVINKLGAITDQKNKSFTVNGTSAITIPAGYYNGQGTISVSGLVPTPSGTKTITSNGTNIDVSNFANVTVNVPNTNSGTFTPSQHGTALDMGANNTYRYINTTNVWNQAVAAADARTNTSSANYQAGYNAGLAAGKSSSTVSLVSSSPNNITAYSNYNNSSIVSDFTTCPENHSQVSSTAGTCYVYTGTASVSKSGDTITVTIPQTVRAANRFCGGSDHTDYSRNITVQLKLS